MVSYSLISVLCFLFFRELLQPAVRVSKIDENKFNQKIILEAFAHYENVTVELKASEAIVLMESSRLAKVACNDIITKNLLGKSVEIKEEQILDHGTDSLSFSQNRANFTFHLHYYENVRSGTEFTHRLQPRRTYCRSSSRQYNR